MDQNTALELARWILSEFYVRVPDNMAEDVPDTELARYIAKFFEE